MEENFCREVRNFKVTGNWGEASLGLLALISRGMRQLMSCPLPKILHFKSNEENIYRERPVNSIPWVRGFIWKREEGYLLWCCYPKGEEKAHGLTRNLMLQKSACFCFKIINAAFPSVNQMGKVVTRGSWFFFFFFSPPWSSNTFWWGSAWSQGHVAVSWLSSGVREMCVTGGRRLEGKGNTGRAVPSTVEILFTWLKLL